MAESDARPILSLASSFPPDAHFAPTVGDLASRLAAAAGLDADDAAAIGKSVKAAFVKAQSGQQVERPTAIDVRLSAGETAVDFVVSCGSARVLTLSRPRPR